MVAADRSVRLWIALGRVPVHLPAPIDHQGVRGAGRISGLIGGSKNTTAIAAVVVHFPADFGDQELIARAIGDFRQPQGAGAVVAIEDAIETITIVDSADASVRPAVVRRAAGLVTARR